MKKAFSVLLALTLALGVAQAQPSLTLYTGRSQALVDKLVQQFQKDTGIKVNVRYGRDAEILAALQEEGSRSPADVFWANTSGALEEAVKRNLLIQLPASLTRQPQEFVPSNGRWVPVSVRFRVAAYNPAKVKDSDFPASVMDLPKVAKFKGRIGWTPTYSSFQDFITAMRVVKGEAATKAWLQAMIAAGAKAYPSNPPMLEAMQAGEIDVALTNHYYIQRILAGVEEGEYEGKEESEEEEKKELAAKEAKAGVATHYFAPGDVGGLALVTGAGILASSKNGANATRFLNYLLSKKAQPYFVDEVREYPVIAGVSVAKGMLPFSNAIRLSPKIDFAKLTDLEGTLKLLREVGLL